MRSTNDHDHNTYLENSKGFSNRALYIHFKNAFLRTRGVRMTMTITHTWNLCRQKPRFFILLRHWIQKCWRKLFFYSLFLQFIQKSFVIWTILIRLAWVPRRQSPFWFLVNHILYVISLMQLLWILLWPLSCWTWLYC